MDLPTIQSLWPFLAVIFVGGIVGFLLGSSRSTKKRRQLQRQLNTQTVIAIEGKTKLNKLQPLVSRSQRKDRLIKLLMKQVGEGKLQTQHLTDSLDSQERKHYIEKARLNMAAAEANQRAQQAMLVAQKATNEFSLLKQSVRATQTIDAPPPKSYGQGQPVPVSVVDQQTPDARRQSVSKMSNRDTHRLTQLQSSNEDRLSDPGSDAAPIGTASRAAATAASLAQSVKKSRNGIRSTRT